MTCPPSGSCRPSGTERAAGRRSDLALLDLLADIAAAADLLESLQQSVEMRRTENRRGLGKKSSYEQEYVARLKTPEDRRYQEVHEGHLVFLKPGEERFLNESLIRRAGLVGPGEDIIARLKALEGAGLQQIAVQVVTNGRELIEEFSREVIARYR